jgi:hypothetical protein
MLKNNSRLAAVAVLAEIRPENGAADGDDDAVP